MNLRDISLNGQTGKYNDGSGSVRGVWFDRVDLEDGCLVYACAKVAGSDDGK